MSLNYYMSTFNLWNPAKKGTLIIAAPRYGSHFLAQAIHNRSVPAKRYNPEFISEAELGHDSYHFLTTIDSLKNLEQRRKGYQIAILNVKQTKLALIAYPNLADNWHIVRITHDDKVQWFKSYWYFLIANNLKFEHHATSVDVYENFLKENGRFELTDVAIYDATSMLSHTLINQYIDCDEHISYSELPLLSNADVKWEPNTYPTQSIVEMFTNSVEFEQMLKNWPKETLSAIRSY